jgi:hypothetical protein
LAGAGRFAEAAEALSPLEGHAQLGAVVKDLLNELNGAQPSRRNRVRLQSAIGDLSLTAHAITRTRKVDVLESRPLRTPQTVQVDLSDAEREVYAAVEHFVRLVVNSGAWGEQMAALMAYRYTASCIPAAVEYMRARLKADGWLGWQAEVDRDFAEDEEWSSPLPFFHDKLTRALTFDAEKSGDTKRDKLVAALNELWADDARAQRPRRKVVLFSYFKRTLDYLGKQLTGRGIQHERVDGGVPLPERETRIRRFLEDPGCPLLISSEVGGEGLDLQAASVVVNYDLPWNPMVVEQRIGRVDRIGQKSERIVIINFICSNTVEDRILHRLYGRIHLFESSIGEIEEILGAEKVQSLIIEHLKGNLSEKELLLNVDKTADAALRNQETAEELSAKVDGLMAADQAILDELKLLIEGNRLPGPADIFGMVRGYLEATWPGARIEGDPLRGVAGLELPSSAREAMLLWAQSHPGPANALVSKFRQGPVDFTVDGDTATRRAKVEYLQARHPLVQFAVWDMARRADGAGRAFACRAQVPGLSSGLWIVGVWSLTRIGLDQDSELVCAAAPVDEPAAVRVGEAAENLLRAVLGQIYELDPRPVLLSDVVGKAEQSIGSAYRRHRADLEQAMEAEANRRLARKRASWSASLQQRVQKATEHLERMRLGGKSFAVRMAEAKLKKWQLEHQRVVEELARHAPTRLEDRELAVVLVDVIEASTP